MITIESARFILIVSDAEPGDGPAFHHLSLHLKALGWLVFFEALPLSWEKYSAAAPSLVVINVLQQEIDGLRLIRQLQLSKKNIPILMVCDRSGSAVDLGASDYLQRPVSPKELVARVKGFLKITAGFKTGDQKSLNPFLGRYLKADLSA